MNSGSQDYNLFFKFIETFASCGFKGIDPDHPLMIEIEEMMEANDQFFLLADAIQMNYMFVSKRSIKMIGIGPENLNPYHLAEATHHDDIKRLGLGKAKMFKTAHDLYTAEKGHGVMSTNYLMRNPQGKYSNIVVQLYLYYSTIPYKSVFTLKVHTNIDKFKKSKHGYHYYVGDDLSYFRYPDEEMLLQGNLFSDREFEIIKLIETGLNSELIAEKLFLSVHTVNTHRRNILEKCGKTHISDLIYDLQERGVL